MSDRFDHFPKKEFLEQINPFIGGWKSFGVKLLSTTDPNRRKIILNCRISLSPEDCPKEEKSRVKPFFEDKLLNALEVTCPIEELNGFLDNFSANKIHISSLDYFWINVYGEDKTYWNLFPYKERNDGNCQISSVNSISHSQILQHCGVNWNDIHNMLKQRDYQDIWEIYNAFFKENATYADSLGYLWIGAPIDICIKEFKMDEQNKASITVYAGHLINKDEVTLSVSPYYACNPDEKLPLKLNEFRLKDKNNCLWYKDVNGSFDKTGRINLSYYSVPIEQRDIKVPETTDEVIITLTAKKSKIDLTNSVFRYKDKKLPKLRSQIHNLFVGILNKVSNKTEDTYISLKDIVKACGWKIEDYNSDPKNHKNRISGAIREINKALKSVGLTKTGRLDSEKGYLCPITLKDIEIILPASSGKARPNIKRLEESINTSSSENE